MTLNLRPATLVLGIIVLLLALFAVGQKAYDRVVRAALAASEGAVVSDEVLFKAETRRKAAALAFELMSGEEKVQKALHLLARWKAKATFFVTGIWAKRHRRMLSRITADGHRFGSLGWSYAPYAGVDEEAIRNDLLKTEKAIEPVKRAVGRLFRPPLARYDRELVKTASSLGYRAVVGDLNLCRLPSAEASEVVKRVRPGSIVVISFRPSCREAWRQLPEILRQLRRRGFSLLTVQGLLIGDLIR